MRPPENAKPDSNSGCKKCKQAELDYVRNSTYIECRNCANRHSCPHVNLRGPEHICPEHSCHAEREALIETLTLPVPIKPKRVAVKTFHSTCGTYTDRRITVEMQNMLNAGWIIAQQEFAGTSNTNNGVHFMLVVRFEKEDDRDEE